MDSRILIADDHEMFRMSLRARLDQVAGMEIVAEAEDGAAALLLVGELEPDIVLTDVMMPEMNGIEATRRITASQPDVKVIGLSLHADKRFVQGMLGAGARGYLLKDGKFQDLLAGIETVAAGGTFLSPELNGLSVPEPGNSTPATGASPGRKSW